MTDNYKSKHWCHSPDDISEGVQYAILEFTSVYIPGDERSRTNPGHGYPASNQDTIELILYSDKKAWEDEIRMKTQNEHGYFKNPWVPVVLRRAGVTMEIKIEVEDV